MKRIYRAFFGVVFFSIVIAGASVCASAQESDRGFDCGDKGNHWDNYRGAYHCEVREQTLLAPAGRLSVDGQRNGGVSVRGWDRREMLVRARIQAWGKSDADVRALAAQIRIETGGAFVRAVSPGADDGRGISVSYEIFLPRESDLALKTYNGGIHVKDVRGRVEFDAHNGGVTLARLAGDVRGRTHNGGLTITLDGDRWDGAGLDARTTNGGVTINVPENYSARLETATTWGGLKIDFPVTVQGNIGKELSLDLGSGGATVRAVTRNGGVTIKRKGLS